MRRITPQATGSYSVSERTQRGWLNAS